MEFYDFPETVGECHHPNWRFVIFFRGVGWNHQPDLIWPWNAMNIWGLGILNVGIEPPTDGRFEIMCFFDQWSQGIHQPNMGISPLLCLGGEITQQGIYVLSKSMKWLILPKLCLPRPFKYPKKSVKVGVKYTIFYGYLEGLVNHIASTEIALVYSFFGCMDEEHGINDINDNDPISFHIDFDIEQELEVYQNKKRLVSNKKFWKQRTLAENDSPERLDLVTKSWLPGPMAHPIFPQSACFASLAGTALW